MIVAPLDLNLLSVYGSLTTSVNAFERGSPGSNLTDQEMPRPAVFRGGFDFSTGGARLVDFTDAGGARVATISAAARNSAAEAAAALAAALTAAGSAAATVGWRQGATDRFRFVITFASGTPTLDVATGPNAPNSALLYHYGFRGQDRAAAASHTGDYAAKMSPHAVLADGTTKSLPGAMAVWDLGSGSRLGLYGFVAGVVASERAEIAMAFGDTDPPLVAASRQVFYASGSPGEDVLFLPYTSATVTSGQFASLSISDPRGEDGSRVSATYCYHGPGYDTNTAVDGVDYEWGSFRWRQEVRAPLRSGTAGHLFAAEVRPRTRFSVAWDAAPGLAPSGGVTLDQLRSTLGRNGLAFVALDPEHEPDRLTKLCRIVEPPSIQRIGSHSQLGRYRCQLQLEVVEVR